MTHHLRSELCPQLTNVSFSELKCYLFNSSIELSSTTEGLEAEDKLFFLFHKAEIVCWAQTNGVCPCLDVVQKTDRDTLSLVQPYFQS